MKKKLIEGISLDRGKVRKIWMTMRLIVFLFFVSLIHVSASVYSQKTKLNIKLENATLQQVFSVIQDQTEFDFFYKNEQIPANSRVSIEYQNEAIEVILEKLLKGTGLTYHLMDKDIVITTGSTQNNSLNSQQRRTASGKVFDSTGGSLPGVSVVVKGTTTGTITDADGNFSLINVPENAVLQFSFVGMKAQEIAVSGKTTFEVTLVEESIGLDEVIAVGYGVQKKSVVTGAISSINADDLKNRSISRAEQALQGKTAGVQILSGSGSPGAAMKIRIRGYSSNGSSDPLYVVDGLRVKDISSVDPNSISNIEILKDAASSSIYGAEAANGVVLITTKAGQVGKSIISYDFQYGMQELTHLPTVMNSTQYSTYMNEAGIISSPAAPTDVNTNWVKEIFEKAPMQKHSISISGGNEKSTFSFVLSHLGQEGVIKGNSDNYETYIGTLNADYKAKNWIKVGANLSFNNAKRNSVQENSIFNSLLINSLLLDPTTPIDYRNGIPASVQTIIDNGEKLLKSPDGYYYGISNYLVGDEVNPYVRLNSREQVETNYGMNGTAYAEITPLKNMTFTSRIGARALTSNSHLYLKEFYGNSQFRNEVPTVTENININAYWQWENYMTYNLNVADHHVTFLAGMSSSKSNNKIMGASGGPLIKDQESYADLDYIGGTTFNKVNGNTLIDTKVSYFGRFTYNYKEKYLLQGSLRRDGASTSILPADNQWGVFPSVSSGWVISNESFFPQTKITFAKLRASWGQNGSLSNLYNYPYASIISTTETTFFGTANALYPKADGLTYALAARPLQLSNPELKWETSDQLDFGFDLRAFNDKLTFSVDYYIKKTKDLITINTPPLEVGNAASPINAGDVLNRGFEFELGYRGSLGKLNYSLKGNLSTLHNEVTYLNPTISRLNGYAASQGEVTTAFEKGYPVWYFRGYKFAGIDKITGDATFEDLNKDGVINGDDETMTGSAIPKINYGLTLNMDYKGLDLTIFGQGQSGNDIFMGFIRKDLPTANKLDLFFNDRWTPTNTNASRPRANVDPKYWSSSAMLFNGAFFRIKQIQLGYSLPSSLLKKTIVSKVRLFVSLEDYFIFTKYPGFDPEASNPESSQNGIDLGYYPTSKKTMFGLSVAF